MNKTLKLLALLIFTGAALNAGGGCPTEEVEEPKKTETEEVSKIVDTEVEESEKSE
jgi:hypothetical protein